MRGQRLHRRATTALARLEALKDELTAVATKAARASAEAREVAGILWPHRGGRRAGGLWQAALAEVDVLADTIIAGLDHLEGDADFEPWLGSPGPHRISQVPWALGGDDDREEECEGEGEACEDEGAQCEGEGEAPHDDCFGPDRDYQAAADAEFTRLTGRPCRTQIGAAGFAWADIGPAPVGWTPPPGAG